MRSFASAAGADELASKLPAELAPSYGKRLIARTHSESASSIVLPQPHGR